jgi:osomolarity two-component system response regulator SSK1
MRFCNEAQAADPESLPGFSDDDIEVLKRRLRQLRVQSLTAMPLRMKSKRPTLSSRARSSPHVRQLLTPLSEPVAPAKRGVIVVHFTSLANYSNVRDCVQSILSPGSLGALPEVIVIPKPVGPRRFLTALHTAVHRPMVDPFFTPIATSPLSPSGQYGSGYGYFPPAPTSSAPSTSSPTQKDLSPSDSLVTGRPVQGRTVSSGSTTSTSSRTPLTAAGLENGLHLTIPRGAEPSEAFVQNARSGMLIQSPDGMPMGMFFDPAPRNVGSRRSSTRSETVGSDRRRSSTIGRPSVATYNSSIDGLLKGSGSGGSRHSRAASLAESTSHGTSLSRRETMSRRSPASEPQHSPLDRSETTSPVTTRVSRIKPSQTGAVAPGVLTHRPSSNSSSNTRPRTPNTEGPPPHPAGASPKTTTSASLPMSPPTRAVLPDNESESIAPAPVLPPPVKKEKKARKPPKDDGVVVPPINVLIVEGQSSCLRSAPRCPTSD